MDWNEKTRLVVTTGRGCEHALAEELRGMGFEPIGREDPEAPRRDAVAVDGNLTDAMRINLCSRTGHRVLFELAAFEADDSDELYEQARELPWELYLREDRPFRWSGSVANVRSVRDSRYPVLKCKDAVADRFVEKCGRRPDAKSGTDGAACLHLHWHGRVARVFVDTTGRPLSMRGYRLDSWRAPVRETMAAAILMEAGFSPERRDALLSPMCGSGTFAIEGALMAQNRAPGLLRGEDEFAFVQLADAPLAAWHDLREEAQAAVRWAPSAWIRATDIDQGAIGCTLQNARRAGVEKLIFARACDFRLSGVPEAPAVVVVNPPYGERIAPGARGALKRLYKALGDWLRFTCSDFRAAVLLADPELARALGVRARRMVPMSNGPIDCRLMVFEPHEYGGIEDEGEKGAAEEESGGGSQESAGDDMPASGGQSEPLA